MDLAEQALLLRAQTESFGMFTSSHKYASDDLSLMHRTWLGRIYPWAGKYRTVNFSKNGLPFAAARWIPTQMNMFSRDILSTLTPCNRMGSDQLAHALAVVHAEFIAIHPFRDGNGRLARWLASLMAAQSGYEPLVYRSLQGKGRNRYFRAVKTGIGKDYIPLEIIWSEVLSRSKRSS